MPSGPQAVRGTARLPLESTGFVGRQCELAALGTLLGRSRLVTVTGPGGVGKTRLALHYASRAAGRYRNGVVLAELSGLRDPDLLPYAVVSALGLAQQDTRDPLDMIVGYLRERQLLLILDTCEHLLDACALLAEALIREAPGVTVLATSRQPLDVSGESACPLAPLRVPEPGAAPAAGDAVELFTQRVSARRGFRITDANREQVIGLCRRLDGIPLAIELAAAQLGTVDLSELGQRLDRRAPVLESGQRDTLPRHRTLCRTIGWSYDLCAERERTLWARLSEFAGPFTVQAAEEVCTGGALRRDDILESLISLVDKSIVIREDGQVPCYRLLGTIREYGAEQLARAGADGPVRIRLIRYYLGLAEELDSDPLTGQLAKYRTLRAQHANLIAACEHGLAIPGQERLAARAMMASYWYFVICGAFTEATYHLARALERLSGSSVERAGITSLAGLLAAVTGDPAGVAQCEEGLAMAAAQGDSRVRARCQLYYCQALLAAGHLPEAIEAGQAARDMMAETGDATASVLWLYLGIALLLTGDTEGCAASCAAGLGRIPADGRERWLSSFLHILSAFALSLQGEHAEAEAALRTALGMRQELGDPIGTGYCLGLLSYAAARQGRHEEAAWLAGATAGVWEALGTEPFTGVPGLAELTGGAEEDSRRALGTPAWQSAFNRAAAYPLEEAVMLARNPGKLAVAAGTTVSPLTRREREVSRLVAEGLSNREIAAQLVISQRTVHSHVEHIFAKLGLSSRVQLTRWARQQEASIIT